MLARHSTLCATLLVLILLCSSITFLSRLQSDSLQIRRSLKNDPAAVEFWISRHLAWHDANRYKPNERRLVFVQNGAGIGDRIKALIAAYGYAVLTRRLLLILWEEPNPLADVLSERSRERFIFRSDLDSNGLEARHGMDYKFRYFRSMPDSLVKKLASDIHTVTLKMGPPKQTPDRLRQALRGNRFLNESIPLYTPYVWKLATQELLERSQKVNEDVSRVQDKLGICGNTERCPSGRKHYISVHARIGLGIGENHWRFARFKSHFHDIAVCFARVVRMYAISKHIGVFVASDTPEWTRVFTEVMKKEMPYNRVIRMITKPAHIRNIKRSQNGKEIFIAQFVEMAILGDATRVVALRSGFSRAAFWMGQADNYIQLDTMKCAKEKIPVEKKMSNGFLDMD